ncbi:hypothetical protein QE250_08670 [Chromatiaceae bacterium AAb-1]|nr:hypothetical protein [Chromatiaceae bacterium AAb-1]
MIRPLSLSLLLACTACSPQESRPTYTGLLKIDAGTEYAALETPSSIGGACDGWNTVEIRKPSQPGTGISNLICWKREGDNITVTDLTGAQRKSGPAAIWSD